ncbi:TPR_REGION domain-containing protein [Tenacibaculum sp. 190130A14a]|uniref:TPR_REGION domain-containing protein n=1 Tax=Tenacibaculum polynesiense TaxID=3137857 RepID=A0ABM9P9P0_9FLAO
MNIKLILSLFLIANTLFAQEINQTIKDSKGKLMLLGKANIEAFNHSDFDWYSKNYESYITNDNVIKEIKAPLKNYKIKVFFGSWCGDSKRELPRFYKVLDKAKINHKNVELIAVDRKPEAYKTSPGGEEKGLNIHRVPTFVFYKENKEVARIVEYPKQDFERDILTIVKEEKYTPNYGVVFFLDKLIKEKGIDELKKNLTAYLSYLSEYTKGSRELNTYGYKLLRSGELEKALLVFELNTKMYPYKTNVFDSYAEGLHKAKRYEEAIKNYAQVLALDSNNVNALEAIASIKKETELNK